MKDKLYLSSNGVNVERFERVDRDHTVSVPLEPGPGRCSCGRQFLINEWRLDSIHCPHKPVRDPERLIWTSSPDRGLKELLDIFVRAKEQVPDLSLHVFYGMDNINQICGGDRTKMPWAESWKVYDRANNTAGVTWRGRIGQDQLAQEYLRSGIWCYPTWFPETSCISCMEAQALGAIPITNPIWATGHNVKHGIFVQGLPADRTVLVRYVDAVVRVATNPEGQEVIRREMMPEARQRLSWERVADQWDSWAKQDLSVEEAHAATA